MLAEIVVPKKRDSIKDNGCLTGLVMVVISIILAEISNVSNVMLVPLLPLPATPITVVIIVSQKLEIGSVHVAS